ncbi:MAG: phosphoribosylaminoimidazolesuccinocarboxamide synthase [Calditrichota bacterium]
MKIQEMLVEGQTKKLYRTDLEEQLVMEFLDNLPITGTRKLTLKGKKTINLDISTHIFEYLASYNVPTHYLKKIDEKSMLVRKLEMIPIQLTIWNLASDSLAKRLGLKDGLLLNTPVIEMYLKNTKLKNPLINDYHAYALELCDRNDMNAIQRIATKANAVLKSFFQRKQLILANFNLEFGKTGNQVILGDEISPDSFVVWAQLDDGKFDKKIYQITSESAKKVYPQLHDILLK